VVSSAPDQKTTQNPSIYCCPQKGLGNIIGSQIGGRQADSTIKRWIKKRSNVFVPEDRLRATFLGAALIMPLSVLGFGLVTQFWKGVGGLVVVLILWFTFGLGVRFLSPWPLKRTLK
jgi:hypothetical protein